MKQIITLTKDDIKTRPIGRNLSITTDGLIDITMTREAAEKPGRPSGLDDLDTWLDGVIDRT